MNVKEYLTDLREDFRRVDCYNEQIDSYQKMMNRLAQVGCKSERYHKMYTETMQSLIMAIEDYSKAVKGVMALFEMLDKDEYQIMYWYYIKHLTHKQVARKTYWSERAVFLKIRHALDVLQNYIDGVGEDGKKAQ